MAFDPTIPDWLEQVEETSTQSKYSHHPELEVLIAIMKHTELLKHYVFPNFLTKEVFNFSPAARKFIKDVIKNNYSLTDMLLEMIRHKIAIQDIVKIITWDLFENLVAAIFMNFGWSVENNFRFKSSLYKKRRFEIDVVAHDKHTNTVVLIDCKRYKNTSQGPIKKAAELQIERTYQLFEALPDMYDREILTWVKKETATKIYPMITTWKDHQMSYYSTEDSKIPITNIKSLRDFVLRCQLYLEDCFHLTWEL